MRRKWVTNNQIADKIDKLTDIMSDQLTQDRMLLKVLESQLNDLRSQVEDIIKRLEKLEA